MEMRALPLEEWRCRPSYQSYLLLSQQFSALRLRHESDDAFRSLSQDLCSCFPDRALLSWKKMIAWESACWQESGKTFGPYDGDDEE